MSETDRFMNKYQVTLHYLQYGPSVKCWGCGPFTQVDLAQRCPGPSAPRYGISVLSGPLDLKDRVGWLA